MSESPDPVESLEHTMARLARAVVVDLTKDKVDVHERLEGLKVLIACYVALNKHPPKKKLDDESTFNDFAEELGALNGRTTM